MNRLGMLAQIMVATGAYSSSVSDGRKFSCSKKQGVKIETVKPKRYTKSKKRGR